MKVFISGSFTENKADFDELEGILTDASRYGDIEVVRMDKWWDTQVIYDTSKLKIVNYWLVNLAFMINCDAVIFCNGWEKHEGCRIERKFAEAMDVRILEQNEVIALERTKK